MVRFYKCGAQIKKINLRFGLFLRQSALTREDVCVCFTDIKHTDLLSVCETRVAFLDRTASTDT